MAARTRRQRMLTLPLLAVLLSGCTADSPAPTAAPDPLPENHGKVQAQLFLGDGDNQPLLVALGGSEGGNAWAADRWHQQREEFAAQGFAVLAVGYFGMDGVPAQLDRIALEGVHQAVLDASANAEVNENCIAVMGGSKGGELALLLGSHFDTYKSVVAVVPGSAVFAGLTDTLDTSSFSLNGEPLPFVPVPAEAVPALRAGDLRSAFSMMLEDDAAVAKASIEVENINGPVLLVSATEDEYWPSTEMSEVMVQRLEEHNFPHYVEHVAVRGNHAAPLDHFDEIEQFLGTRLLAANTADCS